jgi:hypothetical protein
MRHLAAVATALALLAPLPALAAEKIDGVWEGAYVCGQGKTALTLTLDGDADGRVAGTFAFGPRSDNPGVPRGRYVVEGNIDSSGHFTLRGVRWMEQPTDYAMVDLKGRAYTSSRPGEQDVLKGTLTGAPGCTEFAVLRK